MGKQNQELFQLRFKDSPQEIITRDILNKCGHKKAKIIAIAVYEFFEKRNLIEADKETINWLISNYEKMSALGLEVSLAGDEEQKIFSTNQPYLANVSEQTTVNGDNQKGIAKQFQKESSVIQNVNTEQETEKDEPTIENMGTVMNALSMFGV